MNTVTVQLPKADADRIVELSSDLTARMHELLERNTEGLLSTGEREELESLVRMSQFAQLVALAAGGAGRS